MNQNVMNNDFLLGILKKSKKKKKAIEENERNNSNLVNQLLKIKESIRRQNNVSSNLQEKIENKVNTNTNTSKNKNQVSNLEENKKTFKNLLIQIIKKLEEDVDKVTKQIQSYNQEKKNIVELDQKEIKKLKKIIIKLYKTIMEIYGAFDVDRNQRIQMLEKIRMNLETNHILLKNINEIEKITGYIPSVKKEEEEEKVEEVQKVVNQPSQNISNNSQSMGENQSNLTIFNLINEKKNKNKNKNENKKNQPNQQSTIINNMVSVVQNLTGTKPEEEEQVVQQEEEESVSVQNSLMKEKKEKINMSKKVSQKLNQMPRITNNTARSQLNQFLMQRLGRTNLYQSNSNPPTQSINLSSQPTSFNSSTSQSQPNTSRNQNIFI
jgi:hypothetical protein